MPQQRCAFAKLACHSEYYSQSRVVVYQLPPPHPRPLASRPSPRCTPRHWAVRGQAGPLSSSRGLHLFLNAPMSLALNSSMSGLSIGIGLQRAVQLSPLLAFSSPSALAAPAIAIDHSKNCSRVVEFGATRSPGSTFAVSTTLAVYSCWCLPTSFRRQYPWGFQKKIFL